MQLAVSSLRAVRGRTPGATGSKAQSKQVRFLLDARAQPTRRAKAKPRAHSQGGYTGPRRIQIGRSKVVPSRRKTKPPARRPDLRLTKTPARRRSLRAALPAPLLQAVRRGDYGGLLVVLQGVGLLPAQLPCARQLLSEMVKRDFLALQAAMKKPDLQELSVRLTAVEANGPLAPPGQLQHVTELVVTWWRVTGLGKGESELVETQRLPLTYFGEHTTDDINMLRLVSGARPPSCPTSRVSRGRGVLCPPCLGSDGLRGELVAAARVRHQGAGADAGAAVRPVAVRHQDRGGAGPAPRGPAPHCAEGLRLPLHRPRHGVAARAAARVRAARVLPEDAGQVAVRGHVRAGDGGAARGVVRGVGVVAPGRGACLHPRASAGPPLWGRWQYKFDKIEYVVDQLFFLHDVWEAAAPLPRPSKRTKLL